MSTPLRASMLIAHALLLNIRIFCIAEALILVFALAIAVLRGAARASALPVPAARRALHRPLSRDPDARPPARSSFWNA